MLFQCDLSLASKDFEGDYGMTLQSEDLFEPNLPLIQKQAKGGTLIMWKKKFDPFVTVLGSPSPAFSIILFSPPNCSPSIQISFYFPTAGRDSEFAEEVSTMHHSLLELKEKYPTYSLFLRGDTNANPKNKNRCMILNKMIRDLNLTCTIINHNTYHHFVGNGSSDSQIDALLHSSHMKEFLKQIHCLKSDPMVTRTG